MPKVCLDGNKLPLDCLYYICMKCGSNKVTALMYPNKTVYRCRECGFKEESLFYE